MRLVFAESQESLEVVIGHLLSAHKQTLAIAESCTGGLITHRLTNVPGSSGYLVAGVIAYAYEAKVAALGVSWDTLNQSGAVSEAVARAMARGVREKFSSTLGLAVTGIAGPGGSAFKPEGRVCFALARRGRAAQSETVEFGARGRSAVRAASVARALDLLIAACGPDAA